MCNIKCFVKKIAFVFIAFVFVINTLSYAVSDNDGSAFITKSEFDALKSNFQSQIDTYNSGIDSKIDSAIASYLNGIRISNESTLKIIHSDWDSVYFMNQEIKPEFRLPEFVWMVGGGLASNMYAYDKKAAFYSGFKKYDITWGTSDTNYRATVDLINGNEKTPGNMYWDGASLRWREQLYIGKYLSAYTGNMYGVTNYRSYIVKPFSFKNEGYIGGVAANTLILAKPKLQAYNGSTWVDANADNYSPTGQIAWDEQAWYKFFISEDEKDGETKDYNHIIVNDGTNTSYYVSNKNWTNRIYKNPDNPIKDSTLGGDSSVETHLHGAGCLFNGGSAPAYNYAGVTYSTMNFSYENIIIPSIGMYDSKVAGKNIYQKKYNYSTSAGVLGDDITWNGVTISGAKPLTLENGFEIGICRDGDDYTYEIEFDSIECYNGTSMQTNANEIDVYLSYVPFGDSVVSTKPVILKNGTDAAKTYITTTSRKVKLEWEAKEESIIYLKCKPHWTSTEYMDKDFTIKLNTNKSSTIVVKTK